jgi:16S rRNA A1518/A1519 N6-dimethyltransferase RsmA/KsgA/DIM1 with predicted DNA glycosylase/AP lyase activity
MYFEYTALTVVVSGILISLLYTVLTGISPVSSTFKSRKKIVKTISLDQEGIICELGAGWGALAFPLARQCPKATVMAYEISPVPWFFMKIRAFILGPRNLKVVRRNFLKEDLSKASLVVCYLYPGAMEKLSSKLIMELKPGAQVISNTFEIPTWTPSVIQTLEDVMCPQIFYYKMERAITSIHQLIDILYSMIV